MADVTCVEFRRPSPPPTAPGLYWARYMEAHCPRIEPVRVLSGGPGLIVHTIGSELWGTPDEYEWFGPITPVREGAAL